MQPLPKTVHDCMALVQILQESIDSRGQLRDPVFICTAKRRASQCVRQNRARVSARALARCRQHNSGAVQLLAGKRSAGHLERVSVQIQIAIGNTTPGKQVLPPQARA
jgi:hypothetical protein